MYNAMDYLDRQTTALSVCQLKFAHSMLDNCVY